MDDNRKLIIRITPIIKLSSLIVVFMFQIIFVRIYYLNSYKTIANILSIIVAIYLIKKARIILNKSFFLQNILLFLFSIVIIILSFFNSGVSPLLFRTILYTIGIIELFLLLEYFSFIGQLNRVVIIFYRLTLFYIILNDLILILFPNIFHTLGNSENYLVGNKFNVGYLHILLFVLSYQLDLCSQTKLNVKSKISSRSVFFLILAIIVSIMVSCSTTLIGAFILLIFTVLSKKIEIIISKKIILLLALIISTFILLLFSSILQYEPIRFIIENILGEDVGLTGRLRIYRDLEFIIKENLWMGYGYGESFNILSSKIGAPNTQNGFLECIFQYGLIGTSLYFLMIFSMFRFTKENIYLVLPMLYLLYMYVILSSAEITLGTSFLIPLSFINAMYIQKYNNENEVFFPKRRIFLKIKGF